MNVRAELIGVVVLGLLVPGAATGVFAQAKKELPSKQLTGEVKGIKSGLLMVSEGLEHYYVRILPKAKVDVTGEGDATLLRPGFHVRFDVKMDKKGNAMEEIKELELFTPSEAQRIDVDPRDGDNYLVAGRITSVGRGGKINVVAGKWSVKATVAKDATVKIGVRDARFALLAKPGDSVTVVGKVQAPPTPKGPGLLIAEEVELKVQKGTGLEDEKPEKTTKKKAVKEKDGVKDKGKEKEKD